MNVKINWTSKAYTWNLIHLKYGDKVQSTGIIKKTVNNIKILSAVHVTNHDINENHVP